MEGNMNNLHEPSWEGSTPQLSPKIQIEDDSLREGLQSLAVTHWNEKLLNRYLTLLDRLNVHHIIAGFPAASKKEMEKSKQILSFLNNTSSRCTPWLLSRLNASDIDLSLRIAEECKSPSYGLSLYIATSEARRSVENWSLSECLERLYQSLRSLNNTPALISFNFEDASRTTPEDVIEFFNILNEFQISSVIACDTAGALSPTGTSEMIQFFRSNMKAESTLLGWHGHNDQGLALANAISATTSGAQVISGTFLGLGERSGNLALEQFMFQMYKSLPEAIDFSLLTQICEVFSDLVGVQIPTNTPLVGSLSYSSQTGTHCSALLKAERHPQVNQELLFSGVPASKLGQSMDILFGPLSGRNQVIRAMKDCRLNVQPEQINQILDELKSRQAPMTKHEFLTWVQTKDQREL
jgi:2-isopropylmalate synthase